MNNYKKLTIFFVSYFSKEKIERIIKKLNKKIKVIIIDNANEDGIKYFFEKKYKNTQVISNKFNSGQTGGINTGLKKIKTKYSLYMDSDISFNKNTIKNFLKVAELTKNFIILAPQHEKKEYIKSFKSNKKNKFKNLILMKMVHGHFLLFNMKNVRKFGYYDEKIFLYFDETDYCLRAYKKNYNIFVLPKEKVKHEGGKSVNIGRELDVEANKHWHFMWSKFYFYKKNYSTFYAYKQTIFDLIKIIYKLIIFSLIDSRKRLIYYNQLNGLVNSYIGNKSFKRLRID
tara:strand:- start:1829 stop:2686 length:858 start_codon:yes stop_codon:yes gene_type:complete